MPILDIFEFCENSKQTVLTKQRFFLPGREVSGAAPRKKYFPKRYFSFRGGSGAPGLRPGAPRKKKNADHDHTMSKREATLQKKWKIQNLTLQSHLRLSKFLTFIRFLRNFSTSSGSRKFSMGDMITL